MPESSLRDVLLPALAGEAAPDAEDQLLAADPSGSEATLMHLARIAAVEAGARPLGPDRLLAWADGADDPATEALVARSGLAAEQLEARLDEEVAARRLAAAAPSPAAEVWPAAYRGDGWELLLGLDEADRLFAAVLEAPAGIEGSTLLLSGLDAVPLHDEEAVLGDAVDVLGGPAEFNPWPRVAVRDAEGRLHSLDRTEP